jgi:hypothetical protein
LVVATIIIFIFIVLWVLWVARDKEGSYLTGIPGVIKYK